MEARHEVAAVAEAAWAELLDELSIEPGMLRFPEGQDRIDIYAYRDHDPRDWGGKAYHGGLLVWSPDHQRRQTGPNRIAPVVKHELVHVIQWMIAGGEDLPIDTWFIEGLPLALADDIAPVGGLDQLDRLTAEYGRTSPISIKSYSQITDPEAGERFYYPMFRVAVEYIMADEGLGKSTADMRDVLIEVAEGSSFETAFERNIGLRLDDFDNEFFSLIGAYLPRYRNPMFAPVPFAVLSMLVVSLVAGAVLVGHRHWQRSSVTEGADKRNPSPAARIGFYSELTVAGAGVIVFFLGALYAIGTEDVFFDPGLARLRLSAYWILASYLLGTVALVLWAVRQWTRESRSAWLVVPLVIVATIAALSAFVVSSVII